MKERMNQFKEQLADLTTMTKRDYLLTLTVCALGGIIIGFLFSPIKKGKFVKVQCGNNSGNVYHGCDEECDCVGACDCEDCAE